DGEGPAGRVRYPLALWCRHPACTNRASRRDACPAPPHNPEGRSIMMGRRCSVGLCLVVLAVTPVPAWAGYRPAAAVSDYFPTPEEQGGWRSLLPAQGEPDDSQKARIREVGGVDWDGLKA